MAQLVRFGMNVFRQPRGFVFGKSHDLADWRAQARKRRERSAAAGNLQVDGQQLTPQHQKQQLIARVAEAKRSDLVQILNQIFPERPVRLEDVFEPVERHGQAARGPVATERNIRERLTAAILRADVATLNVYSRVVSSLARAVPPVKGVSAREPVHQSVEPDHERGPLR